MTAKETRIGKASPELGVDLVSAYDVFRVLGKGELWDALHTVAEDRIASTLALLCEQGASTAALEVEITREMLRLLAPICKRRGFSVPDPLRELDNEIASLTATGDARLRTYHEAERKLWRQPSQHVGGGSLSSRDPAAARIRQLVCTWSAAETHCRALTAEIVALCDSCGPTEET